MVRHEDLLISMKIINVHAINLIAYTPVGFSESVFLKVYGFDTQTVRLRTNSKNVYRMKGVEELVEYAK